MRIYSKLACFIGGVLFGSVGIKLLSSKDAKPRLRSLTKTMRKTKSRKNESSAAKGAVTAAPFFMEVFQ